jgi:O-antigen/teichoic acid export membrane protein
LLAARQGLASVLGFTATAVMLRSFGAEGYGTFAVGTLLVTWLQMVVSAGLSLTAARDEAADPDAWAEACGAGLWCGLLATVGGGAVAASGAASSFGWVAAATLATAPLQIAGTLAVARLERRLSFGTAAHAELVPHVVFVGTAIPGAWATGSPWAGVAALWLTQLLRSYRTARLAGLHLPSRLDPLRSARVLGRASGAAWSVQAVHFRHLVAPLVVAPLLGAEGVAWITFTHRIVESAAVVKNATWRMSVLALVGAGPERLSAWLGRWQRVQVLALGPLVVAGAWVVPGFVLAVFGPEMQPVAALYPWVAAAAVTHAALSPRLAVAHALGQDSAVAATHVLHVATFAAATRALVPRSGVLGYALAEIVATAWYLAPTRALAPQVRGPDATVATVWWAASVSALALHGLGRPDLSLLPCAVWLFTWKAARDVASTVRSP